jgi:hypothetical protein
LRLLAVDSTKIVINLGLSGSGKMHLLTQLVQQGERWVLLYDCGSNAREIGQIIRDYWRTKPKDKLGYYHEFSADLELMMLNFQLAHAFTLLRLLQGGRLEEPGQFLRYVENGGQADIGRTFEVLLSEMQSIPRSQKLKNLALGEICQLTKVPVVEAWDEAGLLIQWGGYTKHFLKRDDIKTTTGAGMVPFSNHPDNPRTEFDAVSGTLQKAGSAFTVACRVARESDAKTIFCGTALRLSKVEADISKDLLKRVKMTTDRNARVLNPWSADNVMTSLQEDLQLIGIPPTTLDTIAYVLQGRPRLVSTFKSKLYHMSQRAIEGKGPSTKEELLMR